MFLPLFYKISHQINVDYGYYDTYYLKFYCFAVYLQSSDFLHGYINVSTADKDVVSLYSAVFYLSF